MHSSHCNQMLEKVGGFNTYNAFMVTSPAFCLELHGLMAALMIVQVGTHHTYLRHT
jgi:hypothetical protein